MRISITDKCNLRCVYCMPERGVEYIPHEDLLTFEEITRIVRLLARLGVHTVRITGGEPMARRGCLELVRAIHEVEGIERIAMTTNGALLKGRMAEARANGLTGVNISMDTLNPERFRAMTRLGDVEAVMSAVDEALECGLRVKLNVVPVRGLNDADLVDMARLAEDRPLDVRFIELMPVGYGASLQAIPTDEVRTMLEGAFGPLQRDVTVHGFGPAQYVRPEGFVGGIGFIGAVSHEFCDRCNRVRITPEGVLKLCLNHKRGLDLREKLRGGATDEALMTAMQGAIREKPRRHGFFENTDDREIRSMNRIGG